MANTEFRRIETFTIANGGTVSNIVNLQDWFILGLDVPPMTGTALTLEGSADGVTFRSVKSADLATNYSSLTVDATGAGITLNPQNYALYPFWRLTAGSSQGAERLIDILGYRG